jgi:hypothetical protein
MRSIKTSLTAAAVLAVGLVLTAPAAHAATTNDGWHGKSDCHTAIHDAEKARHDYDAAVADLKKEIADGGHPDASELQNVEDLKDAAKTAVWNAVEACKGEDRDRDHHHMMMRRHPHGAMHTGVGSTSQGVKDGELAGGVGILGAAGAGALALRRRRTGSES